jgi:hypothetical protein
MFPPGSVFQSAMTKNLLANAENSPRRGGDVNCVLRAAYVAIGIFLNSACALMREECDALRVGSLR